MFKTLEVSCTTIVICCKNDGKSKTDTASDNAVKGTVPVLCEFSLPVIQQNHYD